MIYFLFFVTQNAEYFLLINSFYVQIVQPFSFPRSSFIPLTSSSLFKWFVLPPRKLQETGLVVTYNINKHFWARFLEPSAKITDSQRFHSVVKKYRCNRHVSKWHIRHLLPYSRHQSGHYKTRWGTSWHIGERALLKLFPKSLLINCPIDDECTVENAWYA